MNSFKPADSSLFFKSEKAGDHRFGEISRPVSQEKIEPGFVIAGYPDDEGIGLNKGRKGAAQAPDLIRQFFYKTTPSHFHDDAPIQDLGNLDTTLNLEQRHEAVKESVCKSLQKQARWIGLGGGHDYGYPDGAGFLLANKDSKETPLVINFDAHLDVRPLDQGLSSGTPFYRLLTDENLPEFDFYEIGIQSQCNSQAHWDWVSEQGGHIISFEQIMMSGMNQTQYILDELSEELLKERPTFISIDIDSFASAYAMGCSQSWPTGLIPNEIFPLLNVLYHSLDVQALGIYEVSPPLDQDDRTVKLAAQLIHQFTGPIG